MNATKILSAVAVAVMALAGAAHAETYEGVQPALTSQLTRTQVSAQAVAAAQAGNAFSDASGAGVVQIAGSTDRAPVRAQAVAAAHDPLANLDRKAFYNSTIPAQFTSGAIATRQRQAERQAAL